MNGVVAAVQSSIKLEFHDADTDTDTDKDTHEEIACVGRKTVAVFGESVSVAVLASWNASFTPDTQIPASSERPLTIEILRGEGGVSVVRKVNFF